MSDITLVPSRNLTGHIREMPAPVDFSPSLEKSPPFHVVGHPVAATWHAGPVVIPPMATGSLAEVAGPGLWAASRLQLAAKRSLDLVAATILLLLLSPLLVAIAMAVSISSPGPSLFIQERIGRDGVAFRMFKFRTMCVDAESRLAEVAHLNTTAGPTFKCQGDPRITGLGRWLRRLSLDELPQLVNVVRGDMSLVGPRPALAHEVREYGPREAMRLTVTPGITGLWQVSGRSDTDFDTWMQLDLEYITTWTLWADIVLLARTLAAVVSARGAY